MKKEKDFLKVINKIDNIEKEIDIEISEAKNNINKIYEKLFVKLDTLKLETSKEFKLLK